MRYTNSVPPKDLTQVQNLRGYHTWWWRGGGWSPRILQSTELAGLFRPWAQSTTPLTSAISQHFPTGNLRPVTRLYLRAKIDHVFDTRSRSRSIESREKTPRGIRLAQRMGAGRTAGLPKEPEHANSMLHECLAVSGGPASIPNPTT